MNIPDLQQVAGIILNPAYPNLMIKILEPFEQANINYYYYGHVCSLLTILFARAHQITTVQTRLKTSQQMDTPCSHVLTKVGASKNEGIPHPFKREGIRQERLKEKRTCCHLHPEKRVSRFET
jgi:hypothetical protein